MRQKIRESPTKQKSAKRVQGRFSRLLLLKERGHIIQCLQYFLIESKKEDGEVCRRPFCPMAEFALARAVPRRSRPTRCTHRGIPTSEFLQMLADLEEEQDNAAFRWGLMISDSRMTVLQCSSSRRLQPSSAESLPLGSKSFKYSLALG